MHNSEINKNLSLVIIFLFSLMTPLGILVGIMLRGISIYFQAILLSFSAGAFLYLSASEVIVEEFSIDINKFEKFYGFGTGIAVITLFTFFEFLH